MSKSKLLLPLLISFFTLTATSVKANLSFLEQAEQYKIPKEDIQLNCEVSQFMHDKLVNSREYQVYQSKEGSSLIVFKSAEELDQKILMEDDNYWLIMPNSQRAIPITPMQRLLGEVAVGDIARIHWSRLYRVVGEYKNDQFIELNLKAKNKMANYQEIKLRLDAADSFPLTAQLYLYSGLLSKSVSFLRGERNGRSVVSGMTFDDELRQGKTTVVTYDNLIATQLPENLFNKHTLLSTDIETLLNNE